MQGGTESYWKPPPSWKRLGWDESWSRRGCEGVHETADLVLTRAHAHTHTAAQWKGFFFFFEGRRRLKTSNIVPAARSKLFQTRSGPV